MFHYTQTSTIYTIYLPLCPAPPYSPFPLPPSPLTPNPITQHMTHNFSVARQILMKPSIILIVDLNEKSIYFTWKHIRKRIHHGSSVQIENSVTRVTVMPNSYPCDGIFNQHLTTIKDLYIPLTTKRKKSWQRGNDQRLIMYAIINVTSTLFPRQGAPC